MSDTVIMLLVVAAVVLVAIILLRGTISRIFFGGARIETHKPPDPKSQSTIERVAVGGKRHAIETAGKGSSISDVKIDNKSEDISIKSSTK